MAGKQNKRRFCSLILVLLILVTASCASPSTTAGSPGGTLAATIHATIATVTGTQSMRSESPTTLLTTTAKPAPTAIPTSGPDPVIEEPPHGTTNGNFINGSQIAQSGDWIYFKSIYDSNQICKSKIDGSSRTVLNEDRITLSLNVIGDWVYFTHGESYEAMYLYKMKTDGTGKTKIGDDPTQQVCAVGDWLYYLSSEKLYKIKTDGSGRTAIVTNAEVARFNVNGVRVYFISSRDELIYKVKTDGTDLQPMAAGHANSLLVDNGWIYYTNLSDASRLYKMRLDGTAITKIGDDACGDINILNGKLYYENRSDKSLLYQIGSDGSGRQKVCDDDCSGINVAANRIVYWTNNQNIGEGAMPFMVKPDGTGRVEFK